MAHCGRLLEGDADAAARDVFDGLFGLVVEAVTPHAVTGRVAGGSGGRGSTRDPAVRQEDEAAVHAAHDGGGHRVGVEMGRGACVCVCEMWESYAGQSKEHVPERERVRLLTRRVVGGAREGRENCSLCVSGR